MIVYADKIRDISTGFITGTTINWDSIRPSLQAGMLRNPKFLIIDDLCEGGRTFIEIAKAILLEVEVARIYLYVTHGFFSAGMEELSKYLDGIYVANLMNDSVAGSRLIKEVLK